MKNTTTRMVDDKIGDVVNAILIRHPDPRLRRAMLLDLGAAVPNVRLFNVLLYLRSLLGSFGVNNCRKLINNY